jgi:hypothetical protein
MNMSVKLYLKLTFQVMFTASIIWVISSTNATHRFDDSCSKHLSTSVNFYQTTWYNIPEDSHLNSYGVLSEQSLKMEGQ